MKFSTLLMRDKPKIVLFFFFFWFQFCYHFGRMKAWIIFQLGSKIWQVAT